jgi:hypothetical protein
MSTLINTDNFDASLKIAAGYSKSANILMKYVGQTRNREVVHSMMVLRALALGIYFRCLYVLDRNKPYRGHEVKQIFDALSDETRRKITEYYDRRLTDSEFIKQTRVKHHEIKGSAPRLDLEQVLQEWEESMGDWQYFFEPRHKVVFLAFEEMENAVLQRLRELTESRMSGRGTEEKSAA